MRALITGISGLVGSHLSDYLASQGALVEGIARTRPEDADLARISVHQGDIRDARFLHRVITSVQPTHVFHLASVIGSDDSVIPYEINVIGTKHLFTAIRAASSSARVIVSSSSAVYGDALLLPICEDAPLRPISDYAASKVAQEMIAVVNQFQGVDVVCVRPFNLIGPRQSPALVTSAIARQIVEAERGGLPVVRIGNTGTERDYTDVRDAVRAYAMVAVDSTLHDVYNICSGKSHSVQECLDVLLSMTKVRLTVERDPERVREHDIGRQIGSAERLERVTGWRPEIPLKESLEALLQDCRRNSKMNKGMHV